MVKKNDFNDAVKDFFICFGNMVYLLLAMGLLWVFSFITTAYHNLYWMNEQLTLSLSLIVGCSIIIFSGLFYLGIAEMYESKNFDGGKR